MTEWLWVQTPHCGDYFSCTIQLDQIMEAKIKWKLTRHCCICCNPAKGRVEFADGWLIKSCFVTKDEMISLSTNQDQTPTKKLQLAIKNFENV